MSELKKRDPDDDYESEKVVKRQKLSEDGPLTSTDILIFKKEALYRQMKLYKHQVQQLQTQLSQDINGNELINQLNSEILDLKKELMKSTSTTFSRYFHNQKQSPVEEKEEVKKEDSPKVDDVNNEIKEEEVQELKNTIDVLESSNSLIKKQLDDISNKYQELLVENSNLKSSNEDELKIQKLIKNNQFLQEEVGKLTKLKSSKINQHIETITSIKESVEKDILAECQTLKQNLHEQEQNVNRLRSHRDELLSQIQIIKHKIDNEETNEALLKLTQQLNNRINQLEKEQGTENEVIQEIEQAFKQTREITLKKLSSTVDTDLKLQKLSIEKSKAESKYFAAMRLVDSLKTEAKILKLQNTKQQEQNKNQIELENKLNIKIKSLTTHLEEYKMMSNNINDDNKNYLTEIKELKLVNNNLVEEKQSYKVKYEQELTNQVELSNTNKEQKIEIAKLEKNLNYTQNMLQKYKSNNTDDILQEEEQQLQALRSIAKCSVCTKNWKDTAITVCGHVFCSSCTQERLAARLRRCPSCNKGFSHNDLLQIHL